MRRPRQTYPPHGRTALAVVDAALNVARTVRVGAHRDVIAQALDVLDHRARELRDELAGDVGSARTERAG